MPRIFVSYSREDSRWVRPVPGSTDRPLIPWLANAIEDLGAEIWHDHALANMPGDDYEKVICDEIDRADFALLLLSQDFILSKFIRKVELPRIRARVERGEMQLIPVLVAPIDWSWNDEARWLQSRQVIPGKPTPLVDYTHSEAMWKQVRTEIAATIRDRLRAWAVRAQPTPRPVDSQFPEQGFTPAHPLAAGEEASDAGDELRAQLTEAEAQLAAAKARHAERLSARAAREREAEVRRQLEAIEEQDRRLAREEEETRRHEDAMRKFGNRLTLDLGGGVKLELAPIPAGKFMMGSPGSEKGRSSDETQHEVTISKPFHMGVHEVTQAQWRAVMGTEPSVYKGDDLPVEQVNWHDALRFCKKLSRKAGRTVRLPTEAEWEYACRAGTKGPYGGTGVLDEMGWYADNSGDGRLNSAIYKENYLRLVLDNNCRTRPVVGKKPNAWGLHDMHGNVWEWCSSLHDYYPYNAKDGREDMDAGGPRMLRGGSCYNDPQYCRAATRYGGTPDNRYGGVGFRVVASPAPGLP
jgi:formylglycine-generating enzyme required for sulfatase activity